MASNQGRPGQLARGILKILKDAGEENLSAKIVLGRLEKEIPPTEFEKEYVKSGAQRYGTNARFISTTLVKAGWLTKDRRQWSITNEGRKAYESFLDPEMFLRESTRRYYQWKEDQPITNADTGSEDENATSFIGDADINGEGENATSFATLEEAQENAWAEIATYLTERPPYDFQEIVAGLLEGMGYYIHWVAPPGPDGGIDIHTGTDPIGVSGKRIKVQVKRRANSLSVDAIRSFQGALEDSDTGIFVSTGGFTREAEKEARRGQRRLVLIDAVRFFELWEMHYEKIPEARRRLLPIKRVSFLDLSNILNA